MDPAQSIGHVERGRIEGKFDQGYLVTVTVGSEKLQGVLYHVPPTHRAPQHATVPTYEDTIGAEVRIPRGEPKAGGSWRKRPRKEEMLKKDPNAPRPNRTGYNFFFAEQVSIFKAMFPDKDKDLSKMIGDAWNRLTEEEKLVSLTNPVICSYAQETHFEDKKTLNIGFYRHILPHLIINGIY